MPKPNETPDVPMDVPLESLQTPDPGALAAMQAALVTPPPLTPVATDPPADDAPVADAPPVDKPGDTPPADTPDPAAAPAAGDPPAGDKPAADTPPADAPPARPSDEFGELPKDVKAETRERFDTLRSRFDEVSTERDEARATAQQWYDTIRSAGTPEQFGEALQVVRDVNAGTPESWKRAHETLTRQAGILAKALGIEAAGYDPLDEHPDLKARVADSVDFTREDALLIAQARKQGTLQESVTARQSTEAQQKQAYDAGIAEVSALGTAWRAADAAEFQAKFPALQVIIDSTVRNLPPAQWKGAIEAAYAKLPKPAPVATAPAAPIVPNSIRPSGAGSSGVDKKPATALEAMQQALQRGG